MGELGRTSDGGTTVGDRSTDDVVDVRDARSADGATPSRSTSEALARRYRAAIDNVVDAIVFIDAELRIIDGNLASRSLAGDGVVGGDAHDLIHPDDLDSVAVAFADILAHPGERRDVRLRVDTSGEWMWVMATAINRLDDPDIGAVVVSFRDLTAEMSLRRSEAMARSLVNSVPIGIVAGGQRWQADYVNDRFAELIGRRPEDTLRCGWVDALSNEAAIELGAIIPHPVASSVVSTIVEWRSGDSTIQLDVRVNGDGSYVVAATDITGVMSELEAERSSAAMWAHAATHDPLTGIANRALGLDRLAVAIAALPRVRRNISVTFVDLDSFKAINDEHGHQAGDMVIREVARRLTSAVRAGDTVARWGGDEFVVIAQVDPSARTPEVLAERLVEQVNTPIDIGVGRPIRLSCSMGMAVAGPAEAGARRLLEAADIAMYDAKRAASPIQVTYLHPSST